MDYTNSMILSLINEHIHSKRDRDIMISRMIDGMRYEPMAEMYGLSTVQVKRIVAREKRRLFEILK
jgi:Mor family transcriptional regulator